MTTADTTSDSVIHKLDKRLVNQIAAGEVIVRPASAVKELVENSFDAGATRIEITIEEDARSFTLRDDGVGMSREDAKLSIERYATSKISEFEDLARLSTRGFRGEALAAISSVSRFELLTRRERDETGTQLRCEGGIGARASSAGLPTGTTIHVRDLFFNTPARMKFLRSPVVEWGYILREILRQALTRPDVAFSIKWRGKPYLTLPGLQSLRDRLSGILPSEAAGELIEVDHTLHEIRVHGCITSPKATRRDRRHQFFFANGRPIVSRPLGFALQEAYKGLIMTQVFPMGALFIAMPTDELDVNVHPTKEEVRFRNESLIAGAIHRAALEALRKADIVPRFTMPTTPEEKFRAPGSPATRKLAERTEDETPSASNSASNSTRPSSQAPGIFHGHDATSPTDQRNADAEGSRQASLFVAIAGSTQKTTPATDVYADETAQSEAALIERLRQRDVKPQILGQSGLTYVLAEAPGLGLLMLDQHAAHEKILYLEYMRRRGAPEIQSLMVPYTYEAPPSERAALEALCPALTAEGFETEHFGGGTFVVNSVPLIFNKLDVRALLRDLLDETGQGDIRREIDRVRHRIGAMAACRAAIKAGDALGQAQMQTLMDQVLETAEALRCPHGRPTLLLLTRDQLDRQFGRLG